MQKIIRNIVSGIHSSTKILGQSAQLGLLLMLVLVFYGAVSRYFFRAPVLFILEISEYLFVFITIICAGWVLKESGHMGMGLFVDMLPKKAQRYLDIAVSILLVLFSAALVWYGGKNALMAYQSDYHSSSLLHFPLWITYAIVPVGAFFLGLQYIIKIKNAIQTLSTPEDTIEKQTNVTEQ